MTSQGDTAYKLAEKLSRSENRADRRLAEDLMGPSATKRAAAIYKVQQRKREQR